MKKIGVMLFALSFLLILPFIVSEEELSQGSETTTTTTMATLGNETKGFECLELRAGEGCKDVESIQELSLVILSVPPNIIDGCIEKLELKIKDNNFASIKDAAFALIALNNVGKDTSLIEKWLIEKKQNPDDITWFLQQDSEGEVGCKIGYELAGSENRYDIKIGDDKKIDNDAGACLKRASSNFWFKIEPSCYEKLFKISCDKYFITNILYKSNANPTVYVLDNTKESVATGTTEHIIISRCLGSSGVCDYEGTAWGAYALSIKGNNIDEFIPYLISSAEQKKMYLPNALIYMLTDYSYYATRLMSEQNQGAFWEAQSTAYNKYYDTSLALLALGTRDQTQTARNWLWYEQSLNGCWSNSVRDTAFILWVLLQKEHYIPPVTGTTVSCSEAGYWCVDRDYCREGKDVSETYACYGASNVICCKERKSCIELDGEKCGSDYICDGDERQTEDHPRCCIGVCKLYEEPAPVLSPCENSDYSCHDACPDNYENIPLSCNEGKECCKIKIEEEKEGLPWWIWLLILLIIIIIGVIAYISRDKIKKRFKKDDSSDDQRMRPGMPPRPGMRGMPPRPGMRGMPPRPGMRGMPPRPGMRGMPPRPGIST
jgi:hypothetical protein